MRARMTTWSWSANGWATSPGWRGFAAAAKGLDDGRFPHLKPLLTGLSGLMDSHVSSDEVRRALPELAALMHRDVLSSTRIICESDGRVVDRQVDSAPIDLHTFHRYGPDVDPTTPWIGLAQVGIEGYEFVVRTRGDDQAELLRACILLQDARAETELWTTEDTRHADPTVIVRFTNAETGEAITVRTFAIHERLHWPNGSYWNDGLPQGTLRRNPGLPRVWLTWTVRFRPRWKDVEHSVLVGGLRMLLP